MTVARAPGMRMGVVFPHTEIEPEANAIRAYAQTVEELGFDHVLVYDHVTSVDADVHSDFGEQAKRDGATSAKPYDLTDPFHEVMVLMGFLAGVTGLDLATGILVLPQRSTALVAKQAIEVDILCGGRLRLGVGIGWNRLEYRSLGARFDDRAARLERQVALLRQYWTQQTLDAETPDDWAVGMGLAPLPVQRPIPIWLAGGQPLALQRVARLADGWIPVGVQPARLGKPLQAIRDEAVRIGRDPDAIGIQGRLAVAGRGEEEVLGEIEQWRQLGTTHLALNTMGAGLRGATEHAAALERIVSAGGKRGRAAIL